MFGTAVFTLTLSFSTSALAPAPVELSYGLYGCGGALTRTSGHTAFQAPAAPASPQTFTAAPVPSVTAEPPTAQIVQSVMSRVPNFGGPP